MIDFNFLQTAKNGMAVVPSRQEVAKDSRKAKALAGLRVIRLHRGSSAGGDTAGPPRPAAMRPGLGICRLQPLPSVAPACEDGPTRQVQFEDRRACAGTDTVDQHPTASAVRQAEFGSRGAAGAANAQQASIRSGDVVSLAEASELGVPQRKLRAKETANEINGDVSQDFSKQDPTALEGPSESLLRRERALARLILFAQ